MNQTNTLPTIVAPCGADYGTHLFVWVVEFGVSVAELRPVDEKFEAFGAAGLEHTKRVDTDWM
jgi:hypothetical protein